MISSRSLQPAITVMTILVAGLWTMAFPQGSELPDAPANCGLRGQVGIQFPDRGFVPAQAAKVYVFYESGFAYIGTQPDPTHFTHERNTNTVGGQFSWRYDNLLGHDKEVNALARKNKQMPSEQTAANIAEHALKDEDDAIAATLEWLAKHPKQSWQVVQTTSDEQGFWQLTGLRPGSYEVVIRGAVSRLDADWVADVDLRPGRTSSFDRMQPRFFTPKLVP